MKAVGRNVLRKDGIDKVRGTSKYVDDMLLPGMLYGRTIRSTVAAATIASVDLAFDTSGFTVVNFSDIPGRNVVALIDADQPALAERVVRHVAEPILLLAHENRETLWSVEPRIEYQPQTPLFDPALSTTSFKSIDIRKGDLNTGFALADHIVEGEVPGRDSRSSSISSPMVCWRSLRTKGSRCSGRSSARTTCTGRSPCCSTSRTITSASCKPRPAAASVARKSIHP